MILEIIKLSVLIIMSALATVSWSVIKLVRLLDSIQVKVLIIHMQI